MIATLLSILSTILIKNKLQHSITEKIATYTHVYRRLHLIAYIRIAPYTLYAPDICVILVALLWYNLSNETYGVKGVQYGEITSPKITRKQKSRLDISADDKLGGSKSLQTDPNILVIQAEDDQWENEGDLLAIQRQKSTSSIAMSVSPALSATSIDISLMQEISLHLGLSKKITSDIPQPVRKRSKSARIRSNSGFIGSSAYFLLDFRNRVDKFRREVLVPTPVSTLITLLRKKRLDATQSLFCIQCAVNRREVLLQPCGHLCLCVACNESMDCEKCPICFGTISETLKINWN